MHALLHACMLYYAQASASSCVKLSHADAGMGTQHQEPCPAACTCHAYIWGQQQPPQDHSVVVPTCGCAVEIIVCLKQICLHSSGAHTHSQGNLRADTPAIHRARPVCFTIVCGFPGTDCPAQPELHRVSRQSLAIEQAIGCSRIRSRGVCRGGRQTWVNFGLVSAVWRPLLGPAETVPTPSCCLVLSLDLLLTLGICSSVCSGFLSILYSIGSKPLQIWDKQVRAWVALPWLWADVS